MAISRASALMASLRLAATLARARGPSRVSSQLATRHANVAWRVSSLAMLAIARRTSESAARRAWMIAAAAPNVSRAQPSTAFSTAMSSRLRTAHGLDVTCGTATPQRAAKSRIMRAHPADVLRARRYASDQRRGGDRRPPARARPPGAARWATPRGDSGPGVVGREPRAPPDRRVIDLSPELTSALEKHRKATPVTTGRVMLLHVMRHSACSALATMGAPMIAIQALAGHESPQTTAKYMHLAAGVQAAAVRLFDEAGAGGTLGTSLDSSDPNPQFSRWILVEQRGIEPRTSALRTQRSPS
jgi:Phage integrase family